MENETIITQKATMGAGTTQIGVQNNYGITAEKAFDLAIKLFEDNFPKLQEDARNIAKERAEELFRDILAKFKEQGKIEFDEFIDPDVQYALNKAQQEYARFGTDKLHDLLRDIVVNRVNYDNDYYIKIVLDESLEIAKSLSEEHLNYISLIFLSKQIKDESIKSIENLKEHCEYICSKLPITASIKNSIPFLNMLRLLIISLGSVEERYSKIYGFDIDKVKEILPLEMNSISRDYVLTPVGAAIAIIHIRNKIGLDLDFKELIQR